MSLRKLKTTLLPEDALEEHVHSYAMAAADPHAAVVAPQFDGLIKDWRKHNDEHIDLIIAAATAAALVVQIDIRLDAAVTELVALLEKLDPDGKLGLMEVFFKGVQPKVFSRPILSFQLQKMALWPAAIADLSYAELTAFATTLAPLLAQAGQLETAADAAAQRLRNWRKVGGYADHITLANAERTDAYGTLSGIPFQQPALHLPKDYADRFYLHDTTRRGAGKPRPSAQILADLTDVKEQQTALDAELAEARAREADAAKQAEQDEKDQRELAELKQRRKIDEAREKELEKKLGKK
jgi:hypothetical protein